MTSTIKEVLTNKQVLKRILYTALVLVVYRILVFFPVPLVNADIFERMFQSDSAMLGIYDAFSGGAFRNFSIVALGISPYITASIVVQLLQMDIIPPLAAWSKEGEIGKQKTNRLTRYLALGLAFIQALGLAFFIQQSTGGELLATNSALVYLYVPLVMTAGTALVIWLADQITLKGIGNGTSIIIMAGIISTIPTMFRDLYNSQFGGTSIETKNYIVFSLVVLAFLFIILAVIFMSQAIRKIKLQYANRPASAATTGKQDNHLPIKLNSAGVIPVIFASALLGAPATIAEFVDNSSVVYWLTQIFSYNEPIGFVLYVLLIMIFSFFYAFVQVNPEKIADNFEKQGAYIPGVRPGYETEDYIYRILGRVTLVGSVYLTVIAILPIIVTTFFNLPASVQLGGTSILIVVGVAIETTSQMATMAKKQQYAGFIKK